MWFGNDWIDFYVYFDWLNLPTISKKTTNSQSLNYRSPTTVSYYISILIHLEEGD